MSRPPDRRLSRLARSFGPEWLAGQRWFRRKGERVARVELDDATQLGDGIGWLLVLVATGPTGRQDRYLVPAVPLLTGAGAIALDALLGRDGRRWAL